MIPRTSTNQGICYDCGKPHATKEEWERCWDRDHNASMAPMRNTAPRVPPLPPHEDHAPQPPTVSGDFLGSVPCPRCGGRSFAYRYEDGSVWTNGHSTPAVEGWCPALPILEQASLEAFA